MAERIVDDDDLTCFIDDDNIVGWVDDDGNWLGYVPESGDLVTCAPAGLDPIRLVYRKL